MTTQSYIDENTSHTFKKGDSVIMYNCMEATSNKGKVWVCMTNSFKTRCGGDAVFLEGFSGYFSTQYLKLK